MRAQRPVRIFFFVIENIYTNLKSSLFWFSVEYFWLFKSILVIFVAFDSYIFLFILRSLSL